MLLVLYALYVASSLQCVEQETENTCLALGSIGRMCHQAYQYLLSKRIVYTVIVCACSVEDYILLLLLFCSNNAAFNRFIKDVLNNFLLHTYMSV